ncbi:MAG: WXG100 family type VII secretion target [Nocardioides sp.]
MTRFQVDLDLLDEVIHHLARHHDRLEAVAARLTVTVGRLPDDWTGAAADAHTGAQAQWDTGFAAMRSALADMRAAAEVAHGNYGAAAEVNVALWREIA